MRNLNDSTHRSIGNCAFSCFGTTLSASAHPRLIFDTPRALSLFYHSQQAQGVVPVYFSVRDTRSASGSISLKIQRPDSSFETFSGTNDAKQELFFAGSTNEIRVGGVVDVRNLASGAYKRTAIITVRWGGTSAVTAVPFTLLVINERGSPLGAGWSFAGLSRLRIGDDTTKISLLDGAGSIKVYGRCGFSCTTTAPLGEANRLVVRDSAGPDSAQYILISPQADSAIFDATGRLMSARDRFGNVTSYLYENEYYGGLYENFYDNSVYDRLALVTYPNGAYNSLSYVSVDGWRTLRKGSLFAIYDGVGRYAHFAIRNDLNLAGVYGHDWEMQTQFVYDSLHRAIAWHDVRENNDSTSLSNADSVVYRTDGTVAEHYSPKFRTADGSDVRMKTVVQGPLSRALDLSIYNWGNPLAPFPSFSPDSTYAMVTSPDGTVTKLWMEMGENPTRVTTIAPGGKTLTSNVVYDSTGRVLSSTDPKGRTTRYTYSGADLTAVEDASAGVVTNYSWAEVVGIKVLSSVVVNGVTRQTNVYSAYPTRLEKTIVSGDTTHFLYDARGRRIRTIDNLGHRDSTVFQSSGDGNSIELWATGPNGLVKTSLARDYWGKITSVTDQLGNVTTTAYDGSTDRVTSVTQPGSITTTFGSSLGGLIDTVTDANSQRYITQRNALGWVTARVDPNNLRDSTSYNALGQVAAVFNRRGQAISFEYDSLSRVTRRIAGSDTTSWVYDPDQKWTRVSNAASTDTVFVNELGQNAGVHVQRGGYGYYITNAFDNLGRRVQTEIYGGGGATAKSNFTYDSTDRVAQIKNPAGKNAKLKYNRDGLMDTLTAPTTASIATDLRQKWSYNAAHGVSAIQWTGGPIAPRFYVPDDLGRTVRQAIGNWANDTERSLTYDALGRLRNYADSTFAQVWQWVCPDGYIWDTDCYWEYSISVYEIRRDTFAYDGVGNPSTNGAGVSTGNRLTTYRGYTMTYDADGNLLTKVGNGIADTLTWNVLGQLTGLVHHAGGSTTTLAYTYDGLGRKATKTVNGTATGYLWNGDDLVAETNPGSGARTRSYTYLPGIDRPQSLVLADGTTYYYGMEEPGHVAGVMTSAGAGAASYEYTPFGDRLSATGSLNQPLQFMGRERDEAGYYYVRARWYDPTLERFVSEDPIGLAGGINPYAYAGNDPINAMDPLGLSPGAAYDLPTVYTIDCPAGQRYDVWFVCQDVTSGTSRSPSTRGTIQAGTDPGIALDLALQHYNGPTISANPRLDARRSWNPPLACHVAAAAFGISVAKDAVVTYGTILVGAASTARAGVAVGMRAAAEYFAKKQLLPGGPQRVVSGHAKEFAQGAMLEYGLNGGRTTQYGVPNYLSGMIPFFDTRENLRGASKNCVP